MTVTITTQRYPEVHKALCALLGPRKKFRAIDHYASWTPRMNKGLGLLRTRNNDDWETFVTGDNLELILSIRDRQNNLRGAHLFLEYMVSKA